MRKSPESAIATFLAMEDFSSAIVFVCGFLEKSHKNKAI
jgi:hypothetical protein